jgi:hypothetical protein
MLAARRNRLMNAMETKAAVEKIALIYIPGATLFVKPGR